MKFSLIGSGFIMPRHAEAIHAVYGKIIEVCNTAHGENTWKRVIQNPNTDCVVILTPNDLHFAMALKSREAHKIVLCEKPLALSSEEVKRLNEMDKIFTVLQLRHHPLVKELKSKITASDHYEIEMDIAVFRDQDYYKSWKGDPKRSGGILFNLGIHYFDLLLYLFGEPKELQNIKISEKNGSGVLCGENYSCKWTISSDEPKATQRRVFKINGENYNFSSKDNLSHENLHKEVYRELLEGKGITPHDALPSTVLIEKLYQATTPSV